MEFPSVVTQSISDNAGSFDLFIDPDNFFFKGHFDEAPVVPGVAQIHWVLHFAKELFGKNIILKVQKLSNLKFRKVIQPKQQLTLILEYNQSNHSLYFKFCTEQEDFSFGKLILQHD